MGHSVMISMMMFWVIFAHVVWDQLKSNINLLTNTGVIIVLIDWVNFNYLIELKKFIYFILILIKLVKYKVF